MIRLGRRKKHQKFPNGDFVNVSLQYYFGSSILITKTIKKSKLLAGGIHGRTQSLKWH